MRLEVVVHGNGVSNALVGNKPCRAVAGSVCISPATTVIAIQDERRAETYSVRGKNRT